MNKKAAALLAVVCLLLAGCGQPADTVDLTAAELTDPVARSIIKRSEDMIWQYHNEMFVDKEASPYVSDGRVYQASTVYDSIDSLKKATEALLSKSFSENVLYGEALDPQNPKFIERDGKLWDTHSIGGMGWINAILMETVQVIEQDSDTATVTAYAQSQLAVLFREEFAFVREAGGWRLDSYFKMNRTGEGVVMGPTIAEYMRDNGGELWQGDVVISEARSATVTLNKQELCQPIYDMFAALEYDPQSVQTNAEWPESLAENGGGIEVEAILGETAHQVVLFQNGDVYTRVVGKPAAGMKLSYPSGYGVLGKLVSGARWELFKR